MSIDSKGRHPVSGGALTGITDKTKYATSTSVHPLGPNAPGLLGGQNLNEDQALLLAAMDSMAHENQRRQWVSWVDQEYIKAKNARMNFERQWYLNLAFTGGRQYVAPMDIAGAGFRLTTPKAPPWRVRLVVNKVRVAVRTECSKLTTNKPIPTVVPATGEDEDYSAATVGEALVKTQFANEEFGETYRQWVWWGVVCGAAFLKSWWDGSAKDYDAKQVPDPNDFIPPLPDGTPVPPQLIEQLKATNPQLAQFLDTPVPAVGKICYERITPFHVYVPDLLAEKLEDQPFLIQVMTRTPLWVKRAFPDAFPGDTFPQTDSRASNTIMDSVSIITKGAEDNNDAVLVKEVWIKPGAHPDFPEGGMLTIVNDKIVQEKTKWPCPFPEFPYYMYRGIPTGGFYPDSTVQDLIPIQKEYNRTRSQAIEIKNVMGKPKILYAQGSVNPRMISSEPGQSIPYTHGYEKPVIIPGAEVPASFSNELNALTMEFDDISGQHEISRGSAPADIKSGTAISFLAEQDDTKLSYQVASIEAAMQTLGKHHLSYVSQYWDENRLVKIAGRNNQYEAISWKQNALRGNTDVRVQTGSALPHSKAARTAQITEFMMNGWLLPEMGLEMLNMGGMEKTLDELLVDKRQAYRENLKMAQAPEKLITLMMEPAPGPNGEVLPPVPHPQFPNDPTRMIQRNFDGTPFMPQPVIPVNSWDNHEAHIEFHNQFRKTQEFEVLPEANKKAFELHIQMHQLALQSQIVNTQGVPLQDNAPPPPPPGPPGSEEGSPEEEGGNTEPPSDVPQEQSA